MGCRGKDRQRAAIPPSCRSPRQKGDDVATGRCLCRRRNYYPTEDISRLSDEIRHLRDLGYDRIKIKIGGATLLQDLKRIEAAARLLPDASHLAVDAIYSYTPTEHRGSRRARAVGALVV